MRTFLSLPITMVIGRCTLDLPQMTVLDLRKAHDTFLLANPRADGTFTGGPNMMSSTIMLFIILYITMYYIIYTI